MIGVSLPQVYAGDTTSLQGAWLLEESSGSRTDSGPNGNTLTSNGTGGVGSGTGQFGTAADFESGDSDYLAITDASQTGLDMNGTDYTIMLWYKPESVGITAGLIGKTTSFNSNGYTIHVDSLNRIQVYIQSSQAQTTAKITSAGTWYHLAFVFDNTADTVKFYLDGTLDTTLTGLSGAISDTSADFRIGDTGGNYADGLIDDVAVFKRQLSGSEISDIRNNGLSAFIGGGRRRSFTTTIN